MHIKIVKEYSESYCELVVTDNYKNIICVCDFMPTQKTEVPLSGTKISMLNAFFLDENPKITLVNDKDKQSAGGCNFASWKLFACALLGL